MLDAIPKRVWIEFWLKRNKELLLNICFVVAGTATAISYWPIRNMLIEQESEEFVHVAHMTVFIVFLMGLLAILTDKVINRFFRKKSWIVRQGIWVCAMVVLFLYLKLIGIEFKF